MSLLLHALWWAWSQGPAPRQAHGVRQAQGGARPGPMWVRLQDEVALPPPGLGPAAPLSPASRAAKAAEAVQNQGMEGAGTASAHAAPPLTASGTAPRADHSAITRAITRATTSATTSTTSTTTTTTAGAPRPVLPTRIPGDFEQALRVRRGRQSGAGRWAWSVQGGRYRTELQAQVGDAQTAAAPTLNWSSHGGLDEHGLAPERFVSQPLRGGARAVNFQRDTGWVSYSGPTGQVALQPGAQDRLSWLVQLLALAQAHPSGVGLPAQLPLWVAGPQGDGADWWFDVQWHPRTQCWQFTRRPERRYEVLVQAWVQPLPRARLIRLDMGPEGSRQPLWQLEDAAQPEACDLPP
ncbi:MAG: hypothetical protein KGP02_08795 [Burkholderiales bacterium]|nr:hypothetical protein [Burkholderiales bacterium]